VSKEWGPSKLDPERRVSLNVGGQTFETSVAVLTRDRFSLLAAMACAAASGASSEGLTHTLLGCGEDGSAVAASSDAKVEPASPPPPMELFLDRDWWVFRHVLAFLRAGPSALPRDLELLRQLYAESAYLRLNSLRAAIEGMLAGGSMGPSLERALDPELDALPQHVSLEDTAKSEATWAEWTRRTRAGETLPMQPSTRRGVRETAAALAAQELDTLTTGASAEHGPTGVGLSELVHALEARRTTPPALEASLPKEQWWSWRDT
jgi:hypothetical protein